ncbi:MAG TPA: tRNA lysidine(34) synthetase TilS [Magnetospirillum sp.]|nr:tRNA lysidine(34) synthetase TilS [Magnetospirillum sp.]
MPTPLTAADFAALMAPLGPFEARPHVAVAVSGGADSLSLALLAHDWARERGGRAVALTVDHGLRPDSAAEAAQVGSWLSDLGVSHHVLRWDGAKPSADIQAQARAARYGLLEDWCAAAGVLHLLLAHHRDDQAETLLLRLARGSGVDGLAAMAPVVEGFAVRLLRPLLGVDRRRLAATLAARGQGWVEDPSNRNAAYARVRMRALLPILAGEGMTVERLGRTAARLGRARSALETMVADAAARWVAPHPAGHMLVAPEVFRLVPEEVGLRLLSRLVQAVGGQDYPPREEQIRRSYGRLRDGMVGGATLAGCRIAPLRDRILVCREAGRMAPPLPLVPGATQVWDGRFRLKVAERAGSGLWIAALGATGAKRLAALVKPRRLPDVPAAVRPTLPAIYDQQGLCAVPHLGYNRGTVAEPVLQWIIAAPAVPLTAGGRCLV